MQRVRRHPGEFCALPPRLSSPRLSRAALLHALALLLLATPLSAQQPGEALRLAPLVLQGAHVDYTPYPFAQLAGGLAALGDLDGDGNRDVAITNGYAPSPELWLVDITPDESVETARRISAAEGGFANASSVTALGDLDGDGVQDLAVGDPSDSTSNDYQGSLRILFLAADGSVKSSAGISALAGGFGGTLGAFDQFGESLAALGDFDGDGVPDLAVGAPGPVSGVAGCPPTTSPGGSPGGSVWLLMLRADGSVKSQVEIAAGVGGMDPALPPCARFGASLAFGGDSNGDGLLDLAVAAPGDDALWLLDLDPTAAVPTRNAERISRSDMGLPFDSRIFPAAVAFTDDLDHDGKGDLAVSHAEGFLTLQGQVHIIFRAAEGGVKSSLLIARNTGGDTFNALAGSGFGAALATSDDWNGDGVGDLLVGTIPVAGLIDPGFGSPGRVHLLELSDGIAKPSRSLDVPSVGSDFASALAVLPDVDGDAGAELVVGSPGAINGNGSVRIDLRSPEGYARGFLNHSLSGGVNKGVRFGTSVASLGNLDGLGGPDLAVGAPLDKTADAGAVWILFLKADGTLKTQVKIGQDLGGFVGPLAAGDRFGAACAALADLDGDGVTDLVVGAPGTAAATTGHVWIVLLNADGSARSAQRIDGDSGGFHGRLDPGDAFGASLTDLGDLDGDSLRELAVGAPGDDDGGSNRGALWVLSLASDGQVMQTRKLSQTHGAVSATGVTLADGDGFGAAVARGSGPAFGAGGLLAIGAPGDDGAGSNAGAVWLVRLSAQRHSPLLHGRSHRLQADSPTIVDSLPNTHWGVAARFGAALSWFEDRDGDGNDELAIGAPHNAGAGTGAGGFWFGRPLPSAWTDFGGGLAGSTGVPGLIGSGSLMPGDIVTLRVSSAPANSPAMLIAGMATVDIPFHGGVLVPRPDRVIGGLLTDAQGTYTLVSPWPNLPPSGTLFFFQVWVMDPGGPSGVAASNAMAALFP